MTKIIFIRHEPLTQHIFNFFSINLLIERNYEIEYWDLTAVCFPELKLYNEEEYTIVKKVSNLNQLSQMLNTAPKDAFYLVDVFFNWHNRNLFKLLKKHDLYYVHLNLFSDSVLPISKWKYIEFNFKSIFNFGKKAYNKARMFIYTQIYKINIYKAHFNSLTSANKEGYDYYLNHPDYDLFLRSINDEVLEKEKYAVFLDEFFPLHPDIKHMLKLDLEQYADDYRASLNRFFDRIEKEFGLKVIIAAHPKAKYTSQDFGGRKIITGKTLSLVEKSDLVIAHGSSSINFAVLNQKPIIFCYNEVYKKVKFVYLTTKYHAKVLNSKIIDTDKILSGLMVNNFILDIEAYNNYKYTYLTSKNTENMLNIDLLEKHFLQLKQKTIESI
ncbi:hypothetical protein OBK23_13330 [Empedobacter falsenii]|uniref:hypothetical protein n=1 Tax=Empedobacter falsenii TaxID=343874 RepID=UPI003A8030F7